MFSTIWNTQRFTELGREKRGERGDRGDLVEKKESLYDPAIPLLSIHTEETRIKRDTCTPVFITALFIIARTWKQPRCPPADERIRKLWYIYTMEYSVHFSSVTQSCPTLCDPMNHSTPGLPVHHQLPEFTQTHVHRVSDAIQPSHPLSSPSPPAPNPSQYQSLFQ